MQACDEVEQVVCLALWFIGNRPRTPTLTAHEKHPPSVPGDG